MSSTQVPVWEERALFLSKEIAMIRENLDNVPKRDRKELQAMLSHFEKELQRVEDVLGKAKAAHFKPSAWDPTGSLSELPTGAAADEYKKAMIARYEEQCRAVAQRNTGEIEKITVKTSEKAANGEQKDGDTAEKANDEATVAVASSAEVAAASPAVAVPPITLPAAGVAKSESEHNDGGEGGGAKEDDASVSREAETPRTELANKFGAMARQNWIIEYNQLELGDEIGDGAFGVVRSGELWGTKVAVKAVKGNLVADDGAMDDFRKEVQLLSSLRHNNVLLWMGVSLHEDHLYLITEYCERGSVYELLQAGSKGEEGVVSELTLARRMQMAADGARGLCYIHQLGLVHCDLKTKNLLVDRHWQVKICDFGLSLVETSERVRLAGTRGHMAPELYSALADIYDGAAEMVFTKAADVYAYGVCVFEMYTMSYDAEENAQFENTMDEIDKMTHGWHPVLPDNGTEPASIGALIEKCWATKPDERPTTTDLLASLTAVVDSLH